MTLYMVFAHSQEDEGWHHMGTHEARSAEAAIRTHIERAEDEPQGGVYSATPMRSWKTASVKVETKTALKFS